ncbi:MAG TPA: aminotransferase class I/II-fold pyridoxal phosphate-dependent enzyme, partial [Planctomycetes bacterium]|nr:aminotransferase class I/II-fold pyridoxal phosphate-dependent enzyme [Planctomycetota bacterium]
AKAGFSIASGGHPIIPIMLGDEIKTMEMADRMNARGIFVVGFSYPVVPRGQARIRVQVSAAHTTEQIERAIAIFREVGQELGIIG